MSDFNEKIIEEFRANRGHVESNGFGSRLVLMHTIGAKSGQVRTNPVMFLPDGDDAWLVVGSAAGATSDPAWMSNLRAHPDFDVELPAEAAGAGADAGADAAESPDGVSTVAVRAVELEGQQRDEAYARFTEVSPGFGEYQEKAGERVIPVVRLTRR